MIRKATPAERRKLNCFIKGTSSSGWLPAVRDGDRFYSLGGLRLVTPVEWRDATAEEIAAEIKTRGEIPLVAA